MKPLCEIYEFKELLCVYCNNNEEKLFYLNDEKDQPVCKYCLETEMEEYEEPPTYNQLQVEANK